AALISLVRDQEINDLVVSIGDLERTFNNKSDHHYTWIFFSEDKFTDTFKKRVGEVVSGEAKFVQIPEEHWGIPEWVDRERFADSLEYLGAIGVGKGWMVSYRHMCRWNSGFFFEHEALKDYDYYWRVEPDVRFFCDLDYDPFSFMAKNELKYGFNMNILDDARSFPSLWRQTRKFLEQNPKLVHKDADLRWILDLSPGAGPRQEVGDLNFFRSDTYRAYFRHLDKNGGFFYERWGDAPVHTLAVALFLPKKDVHFFRDIGYQHGINMQCP
ncbi:nucleotide-diphospho-sugar transferase, partial [Ascobolus immersus RN42]